MMRDGWGAEAMFPPIASLSPRQHNWLSFVMVPPNLQLMFAPGAVSYTLLVPGRAGQPMPPATGSPAAAGPCRARR